jgi:hypothetical protein
LLNVPKEGDMDQFTPGLLVPLMLTLKVADWPPASETVAGEILTETGFKETVALSLLVESAALVAVTVTVWAEAIVAGAV